MRSRRSLPERGASCHDLSAATASPASAWPGVDATPTEEGAMKHGVFRSCLVAVLLAASTGAAQTFGTKSIRLISGTTPGSASDTVARALTERLQANLGQPVIVENRLGAGGMIAAASVAKGDADGSTILVYTSAYTV